MQAQRYIRILSDLPEHPRRSFWLMMVMTAFFSLFRLGAHPLMEWDESLHGELALQMLQRGDWLNYFFGGQPEAWFAKPPLALWAVAASYKLFGTNAFALRLPSALAMIVAFGFVFRSIAMYKGPRFAFFSCCILLSVKGLIGDHVGRSGDTDALLVCWMMIASWHFLRLADFGEKQHGIWLGIFLGLAFWTKGPTALIFVPAWLIYLMVRKKLRHILMTPQLWIGSLFFVGLVGSWIWLSLRYGQTFPDRPFMGENSLETMLRYDILDRFLQKGHEDDQYGIFFFPLVLDAKFNLWNYVGYALLLFSLFKGRLTGIFTKDDKGHLHLYSLLIWLSLAVFLSLTATKKSWYMAPVWPFLAINLWGMIVWYWDKRSWLPYVFAVVFLLTLGIRIWDISIPEKQDPFLIQNQSVFTSSKPIIFSSRSPMKRFLGTHFLQPETQLNPKLMTAELVAGILYVIPVADLPPYQRKYPQLEIVFQDKHNLVFTLPTP
ncbi:MAG: glycosyltransferase family 39 protein [Bacteroidota bacterium]